MLAQGLLGSLPSCFDQLVAESRDPRVSLWASHHVLGACSVCGVCV